MSRLPSVARYDREKQQAVGWFRGQTANENSRRMDTHTAIRAAVLTIICSFTLTMLAETKADAKAEAMAKAVAEAEAETEAKTEAKTEKQEGAQAETQVRLPAVISDGMLVQRDEPFKVWGWAAPEESFGVCWQDQCYPVHI